MVTLRTRLVGSSGAGEGSGSGYGAGQLGDQMKEFILSKIICSIMDQTPMIFGTVKEGILEILDETLGAFHTKMAAMMGRTRSHSGSSKIVELQTIMGLGTPLLAVGGWLASPMASVLADISRGIRSDLLPIS